MVSTEVTKTGIGEVPDDGLKTAEVQTGVDNASVASSVEEAPVAEESKNTIAEEFLSAEDGASSELEQDKAASGKKRRSKKKKEEPKSVASSDDDSAEEADVDEIMRKYDKESNTRIWIGAPKVIVGVLMAAFSVYCIGMTLFSTTLPEVKLTLFLGCVVIIGFLNYPANKKQVKPNYIPWYDIVLMVVGAGCFFFFAANALTIVKLATNIQPLHVIIGIIGIAIVVELCRRCVGLPIIFVCGALIVYALYFQLSYNPDFFKGVTNVIYKLFYTTSGIIGTPINVCYTYIVLFIIFGAFLERTGIAAFFISFANRIAGWSSGGAAKVAVVSSALCGMVSGSSVGNTVTTGSVTIPMMKKTGYRPEFAGAVEAASSTGGQIMPPIMGAAAFLMAEYIGIPYIEVAAKAILPAALYFAGIFISVHLEAKRLGLKGIAREDLPKWGYLFANCYLIIPLVLLVVLVSTGARTMAYSAALSILAAFVVGTINFLVQAKKANPDMELGEIIKIVAKQAGVTTYEALQAGARSTVTVAVACAMAGMIAGCITVTGLASVLINGIVAIAGDATIIGLLLTMLCCIVLGMGVPTTANYCIMASTCAPILVQMGIPMVAAHFFVFYFGIVADITPPVALAAYAGSAIARSSPMRTGVNATKLAIAAFLVPYIFAFNPIMLMDGAFDIVPFVICIVTAVIGLFGIAAALNGHLYRKIPIVFRLALVAGGLCMMVPETITDIIGVVVVIGIVVIQRIRARGGKSDVDKMNADVLNNEELEKMLEA